MLSRQLGTSATNNILHLFSMEDKHTTSYNLLHKHEPGNLWAAWRYHHKTHLLRQTSMDSVIKLCISDLQPVYNGTMLELRALRGF